MSTISFHIARLCARKCLPGPFVLNRPPLPHRFDAFDELVELVVGHGFVSHLQNCFPGDFRLRCGTPGRHRSERPRMSCGRPRISVGQTLTFHHIHLNTDDTRCLGFRYLAETNTVEKLNGGSDAALGCEQSVSGDRHDCRRVAYKGI